MIRHTILWGIVVGIACPGQAFAGWIIDQSRTFQGLESKEQIFMQANQWKTVTLDPDGKPAMAFIIDLNNETVTDVNYGERSYMTAKAHEYYQMIGGPIKNAQNAAKEAFKGVEAAQREVIESMMRSPEAFKDVTSWSERDGRSF
jgi:hypothetical protein